MFLYACMKYVPTSNSTHRMHSSLSTGMISVKEKSYMLVIILKIIIKYKNNSKYDTLQNPV